MAAALLAAIVAMAAGPAIGDGTYRRFIIYDKQEYKPEQYELATRSPVAREAPTILKNGAYWVPRSMDGHFYVPGSVNGFPVVFMIDTGASQSSIPAWMARNAGIRAGREVQVNTAGGRVSAGESQGNNVHVGPFSLSNVTIIVAPSLEQPLLGMGVLGQFTMTTDGAAMLFVPRN